MEWCIKVILITGLHGSKFPKRYYNLLHEPCPTIMAGGVAGCGITQYELQRQNMNLHIWRYSNLPPIDVDLCNSSAPCVTAQGFAQNSHYQHQLIPTESVQKNMHKFSISTMQEIAKQTQNGFSVISTFSGCGGSSTGYKMVGFNVLWANEFHANSADAYSQNHPKTILNTKDIRTIDCVDVLKDVGLSVGELDVLDGSPPCDSFSIAGKGSKLWGKEKQYRGTLKQRTDDLFFEYIRFVKKLQPKMFVAENVSGLVKGKAKGYFKIILAEMKDCGYNVKAKVLDAQWLGVPQHRQRVIFIGVRNDLNQEPIFPKPFPFRYSVADACPWIAKIRTSKDKFVSAEQTAAPSVMASDALRSENAQFSSGGFVSDIKGKRKFTIEELKRICAFPDDYILTGSYARQWELLGMSVPPLMMKAIAKCVCEVLEKTKQKGASK